jgi:cystathionine gamma-synthase
MNPRRPFFRAALIPFTFQEMIFTGLMLGLRPLGWRRIQGGGGLDHHGLGGLAGASIKACAGPLAPGPEKRRNRRAAHDTLPPSFRLPSAPSRQDSPPRCMDFAPIPLGAPIPDSPHAVSCSLPTMAAVRGYEEKDPAVTASLRTGYPRFVVHPFARRLGPGRSRGSTASGAGRSGSPPPARWPLALLAHLGPAAPASRAPSPSRRRGDGVSHPESRSRARRSSTSRTSEGSSPRARPRTASRRWGGAPPRAEETLRATRAEEVLRALRPPVPGAGRRHPAREQRHERRLRGLQGGEPSPGPEGPHRWVQLGWLYLDTIAILRKFTAGRPTTSTCRDVMDLAELERVFAERGARIAGVMAEVPNNPLVQTPDVAAAGGALPQPFGQAGPRPVTRRPLQRRLPAPCDLVVTASRNTPAARATSSPGLVAVNPAAPGRGSPAPRGVAAQSSRRTPATWRASPRRSANTGAVLARIEESTPGSPRSSPRIPRSGRPTGRSSRPRAPTT